MAECGGTCCLEDCLEDIQYTCCTTDEIIILLSVIMFETGRKLEEETDPTTEQLEDIFLNNFIDLKRGFTQMRL